MLRVIPLIIMLLLSIALAFGLLKGKSHWELGERPTDYTVTPFNVPALSGQRFSPSTWQGRVAVLSVFASWCEPCAAEHETIMKIAQSGKVAVYGLAWRDKAGNVSQWIKTRGNPYQSIGVDEHGETTVALALTGVPETFIFDKKGRIAYHYSGALTDDMAQNVILPLAEKLNAE